MNSIVAASRRATVMALRRAPAPASAAAAGTTAAATAAGAAARGGVIGAGMSARGVHNSPVFKTAYNTFWKSTPVYVTYIVVGCVVLEFLYGKVGDSVFDSINKGKQYKDIDWSKFAEEEDEEEEEEEDDDE